MLEKEVNSMNIIVVSDYEEMSEKASLLFSQAIKENPKLVLGLATGSTPLGLYQRLVKMVQNGQISFRDVTSFNLDEYVGLPADHPQSYRYFMNKNLFSQVDIKLENTFVPSGVASDLEKECEAYTEKLAKAPQDLQLLGLGSDGHIGFNEPGTSFSSHTHVVRLAECTIRDNSRLFDRIEDVPKEAITIGIQDVMQAKNIIMLVNGSNKAEAVKRMIQGPVDESCPASILQKHPSFTVILDKEAAKLLSGL